MEYLRLGDLRLTTADSLTGFEETAGYNYAQQDVATGPPILQSMGETLAEVSLAINLRKALGHDIEEMIRQIDQLRRSGDPQHVVFANGAFQGDYVITERHITVLRTDALGNLMEADIGLNMRQYVERIVVQTVYIESRPTAEKSSRKTTRK